MTMAGIVRMLNKCTPIDNPIMKAIKTIQRSTWGCSACSSHIKAAQNIIAVKKEESAYTSPSTAENQKESVKVKANAPTTPAPIIAIVFSEEIVSPVFTINLLAKCVMVQKRNKIVIPLDTADIKLTLLAAVCGPAPVKMMKRRANIKKKGAPGGCGTCNLKALDMNSPQSQRLAVASLVEMKTIQAMMATIHPVMLLVFLKFMWNF